MKRFYTLFLFLLGIVIITNGQTSLGIKGGINWLNFRSNPQTEGYEGSFASPASYCLGMDLKGLTHGTKYLNLGISLEYSLNNINWNAQYGGVELFSGQNIRYKLGMMRFSIYPELSFGKRVKFFFNIGPYFSLIVNSTKEGIVWDYSYENNTENNESGSAKDDFKSFDLGLREGMGIGYSVLPCLVLSLEENGGIGFLNIDNTISQAGYIRTSNFCMFLDVSYLFLHRKGNK